MAPRMDHLEAHFPGNQTHGIPAPGSAGFWEWYVDRYKPETWRGPVPKFSGLARSVVAFARVDHGRWLVDCPYCTGACFAGWEERRFVCAECLHAGTEAEGQFIRVEWPKNHAEIEDALARRPMPRQNWWPGEHTSMLRAETEVYPPLERARVLRGGLIVPDEGGKS